MINFKSAPFLKVLLPYLAGILFVQYSGQILNPHVYFLYAVLFLISGFTLQRFIGKTTLFKKHVYTLGVNLFLFVLAFETCFFYNAKNCNAHYSHFVGLTEQPFIATITDIPVNTGKFTKITVQVNAVQYNKKWKYSCGSLIMYLKNSGDKTFQIGQQFYTRSKFSYINEPQNPGEFNYKRFMEYRNIYNVAYSEALSIYNTGKIDVPFSLSSLGCTIKQNIVSALRNTNLSQHAFSICSALLVGYDDEIEGSVLTSFSHSGTLHVLSVSGMHTGVLYVVLIWLFSLLDKHNRYAITKCFCIIIILGMFVLITGFSPSVLRASLMLALIIIGKTFKKGGNAYNTLLFSAFLLLLYDPYLINDIGFLLSYFAVFGIMYLYPILMSAFFVENKILKWFCSVTFMSVAATVFTLPISLYYFHQFPVWFIFSNLIIIPLSVVLMGATALLLIFYKIVLVKQAIVWAMNFLTSLMLWFTQLTDSKSFGFIDNIPFTIVDVFFSSCVIGLALLVFSSKTYKSVVLFFLCCIAWLGCSVLCNIKELKERELVVFNVKHKSAYAMRVGQTVYLNSTDLTEKEFQRFVKPYLLKLSNLKVVAQKGDILTYKNFTFLHATGTYQIPQTDSVGFIIVSQNATINVGGYFKYKPLIIADCTNSNKFTQQLKDKCSASNIPFYSVRESGALMVNL